jgi:CHAD domain-containing protein
MQQHQLENIIRLYYRKLAHAAQRMDKKAGKKNLHSFRVLIKQLRAFFRLLSLEKDQGHPFKLPPRLKRRYAQTGKIRMLQLQLQTAIDSHHPPGAWPRFMPAFIKQQLKKQAHRQKPSLCKKYFHQQAQKAIDRLPLRLRVETLQLFFREKLAAIHHIMNGAQYTGDELHSIRKNIKDILYVTRIYTEQLNSTLPLRFWKEGETDRMKSLAEALGKYNDTRSSLSFLENTAKKFNGKAKEEILAYRHLLLQEKQADRNALIGRLQAALSSLAVADIPGTQVPVNDL